MFNKNKLSEIGIYTAAAAFSAVTGITGYKCIEHVIENQTVNQDPLVIEADLRSEVMTGTQDGLKEVAEDAVFLALGVAGLTLAAAPVIAKAADGI